MQMSVRSSLKNLSNATSKLWQEWSSSDHSIYRIVIVPLVKKLVLSKKSLRRMTVFFSILTLGAMIQKYSWTLLDLSFLPVSVGMFSLTTLLWLLVALQERMKD